MRSQIIEAQKIAGGSGTEQDIAEAKVELEVRSPGRCFFVRSKKSYSFLGIGRLAGGAEVVIATTLQSQLYNNGLFQQTLSIFKFENFSSLLPNVNRILFFQRLFLSVIVELLSFLRTTLFYVQMTSLRLSLYQADA